MKKLKNISLAVLAGLLVFVMTAVGLPFGVSENTAYAADDKVWPKNPRITRNAAGEIESVDYDTIILGEYNDTPIVWRVLNVDGDKALLFADDVICNREYHPRQQDNPTWAVCDLRDWLNGTGIYAEGGTSAGEGFIDTASFSNKEKAAILTTQLTTFNRLSISDNAFEAYENTEDKVFLLSIEDLTNEEYGFPNNPDAMYSYGPSKIRKASNDYWTRSKGVTEPPSNVIVGNVSFGEKRGKISFSSGVVTVEESGIGVRPAMWVDLIKLGYEKPDPQPSPDSNVTYKSDADEKLTWTKGNGKDLTFTVKTAEGEDDSFEHFESLKIDGEIQKRGTDYEATKGSTIITIKVATLEALEVGEHKISVVFDNGAYETTITVEAARTQPQPESASPATGDSTNIIAPICISIIGVGVLGLTVFVKKKQHD